MADQLGGGVDPADPTAIRNQPEPTVPLYQIWDQINGLNSGLGQAQGLVSRAVPPQTAKIPYPNMTGGLLGINFQEPFKYKEAPITKGTPAKHITLNQAISDMHNWSPEKLAAYTARLYNAGMYADRAYSKGSKPPSGKVVTEDDVYATINLISTAQRYGDTKTIEELLTEFTAAGEGQKKLESAARAGKTQGQVYTITTDDPASLRATVTQVAQAVLGRAVSDDEQAALVEQMIQAQRAPQEAMIKAGQTAEAGSDVRLATARVDAESRLKEKLQVEHGAEASAYSELNYFNLMSQALRGER